VSGGSLGLGSALVQVGSTQAVDGLATVGGQGGGGGFGAGLGSALVQVATTESVYCVAAVSSQGGCGFSHFDG